MKLRELLGRVQTSTRPRNIGRFFHRAVRASHEAPKVATGTGFPMINNPSDLPDTVALITLAFTENGIPIDKSGSHEDTVQRKPLETVLEKVSTSFVGIPTGIYRLWVDTIVTTRAGKRVSVPQAEINHHRKRLLLPQETSCNHLKGGIPFGCLTRIFSLRRWSLPWE